MKKTAVKIFAISLLLTGSAFASANRVDEATLDQMTADWPQNPKMAIHTMMGQYGLPNEASSETVTWYNNGVWKRTVVNKLEIEHLFPKKHTDFLEQTINYQVPPSKFTELAFYDGSVIVERTKGELSARCDKEGNNFLALNLAKDVIDGKLTVNQARWEYTKNIKAVMRGEKPAYTQALQFKAQKGPTGDPDHSTIK